MKVESCRTWPWQVAMVAAFSFSFGQAWACGGKGRTAPDGSGTKTAVVVKDSATPVGATNPLAPRIQQVRVSWTAQHTQVRMEASGHLSCVASRLRNPERVVLDFSGALVSMQQKTIPSNLPPVRAVRVGQFKADVARVVIDLDRQVPYNISVNKNVVTVVFGSAAARSRGVARLETETPVATTAKRSQPPLRSLLNAARAGIQQMPLPESRQPTVILPTPAATRAEPFALGPPETVPTQRTQPASGAPVQQGGEHRGKPSTGDPDAINPRGPQDVTATPTDPESEAPSDIHPSSEQKLDRPVLHKRSWRYRLRPGDVLELTFPFVAEFNQTATVQPDGYITVHGLGDLQAEGKTVPELTQGLRMAYGKILHEPVITVDLKDFEKPYFIVGGEVGRPGKFEWRGDTTVSEAIAIAGGLRETARHSQVLLIRRVSDDWAEVKKINVKKMLQARNLLEDPHVQPGDMLFVPKNAISKIKPFIPVPGIAATLSPSQF